MLGLSALIITRNVRAPTRASINQSLRAKSSQSTLDYVVPILLLCVSHTVHCTNYNMGVRGKDTRTLLLVHGVPWGYPDNAMKVVSTRSLLKLLTLRATLALCRWTLGGESQRRVMTDLINSGQMMTRWWLTA